jgi:hypothetical protein
MPPPELVELYAATNRLAREWNIPVFIAEQIVRSVLRDGECFVRGKGRFDLELRNISGEVGAALSPGFVYPLGFTDVAIDWNDLLKYGRRLVPSGWEPFVAAADDSANMPALKSNDELRAVDFLAPRLREDPNIKRDDAWKMLRTKFPTLSKRGFEERVWPNARARADLPAAAPPGPKPKSNQTPTRQNRRT